MGGKMGGVVRVAPGQTRPLKVKVREVKGLELKLTVRYRKVGGGEEGEVVVRKELDQVERWGMQKYTYVRSGASACSADLDRFLHPSGVVSYAVLRPPGPNATCEASPGENLPVMIFLHGAATEADSPASRGTFDAVPNLCAWILMPQGVTGWGGDDWRMSLVHWIGFR